MEISNMENTITKQERTRRRELAAQAHLLITQTMPIEDADESSLMLCYNSFYLQIAFSELHPLMLIYLARALNRPGTRRDTQLVNDMNLKSVLGSHAVNPGSPSLSRKTAWGGSAEAGCYSFRAAHWLDVSLEEGRFAEILSRCAEEAARAYAQLTSDRRS
jgi:hypothetical protein